MMLLYIIVFGFLISVYALYEVGRMTRHPDYKPLCDFSESVSCSRAFLSTEGNHFGLPNPFLGVIFFSLCFVAVITEASIMLNYLALLGLVSVVYLGYVLYFRIKSMCVVCTLIYLANIAIFILVFF